MIQALLFVLLAVYLVERARPLVVLWLQRPATPVVVEETPAERPTRKLELPHALRLLVNSEGEQWAREQTEQRFRELFADLGSWDAVESYVHSPSHGRSSGN